MDLEEVAVGELDGSTIHEWIYDAEDTTALTIDVAALDADVTITLFDPSGNGIATTSSASGNQTGRIRDQALNEVGEYTIQVRAAINQSTHYGLLITSDDTDSIRLAGVLEDGDDTSGTLGEDGFDYWLFWGTAGDAVTITVSPQNDSEPYVILYDSEDNSLESSSIDPDTDAQVIEYTLTENNVYLIWVEEFDFLEMTYDIELTIE